MYILFINDKFCEVIIEKHEVKIIDEYDLGDFLLLFYNHFAKYQKENCELFLNSSQEEINDAIISYHYFNKLIIKKEMIQFLFYSLKHSARFLKSNDTVENKYNKSMILLDDEDTEDINGNPIYTYTPVEYTSFFFPFTVPEIVQIYIVETLKELVTLIYCHLTFGANPKNFAICPNCQNAFIQPRANQVFCTQKCNTEYNNVNKKKNPYYSKYRNLQQRYNRLVNKEENEKINSFLNTAYFDWQIFAKKEFDKINEDYQDQPTELDTILFDVFKKPLPPVRNIITPEEFADILKSKWKGLTNK